LGVAAVGFFILCGNPHLIFAEMINSFRVICFCFFYCLKAGNCF